MPSTSRRVPPPLQLLALLLSTAFADAALPLGSLAPPAATTDFASFARSLAPKALLSIAALAVFSSLDKESAPWPAFAASSLPAAVAAPTHDGLADDCFNVYLDFGSNVGVQVRKLFEPELYPHGPVLRFFDSFLGPAAARRESACAFGFEINPLHTSRLLMLQAAYSERGWRTRFFTETGIGLHDTTLTFQSDYDAAHLFWGSKLVDGRGGAEDVRIPVVSITCFVRTIVLRHIPPVAGALAAPHIVMKLDCEGKELELLQQLFDEGLLCSIAFIFMSNSTLRRILCLFACCLQRAAVKRRLSSWMMRHTLGAASLCPPASCKIASAPDFLHSFHLRLPFFLARMRALRRRGPRSSPKPRAPHATTRGAASGAAAPRLPLPAFLRAAAAASCAAAAAAAASGVPGQGRGAST